MYQQDRFYTLEEVRRMKVDYGAIDSVSLEYYINGMAINSTEHTCLTLCLKNGETVLEVLEQKGGMADKVRLYKAERKDWNEILGIIESENLCAWSLLRYDYSKPLRPQMTDVSSRSSIVIRTDSLKKAGSLDSFSISRDAVEQAGGNELYRSVSNILLRSQKADDLLSEEILEPKGNLISLKIVSGDKFYEMVRNGSECLLSVNRWEDGRLKERECTYLITEKDRKKIEETARKLGLYCYAASPYFHDLELGYQENGFGFVAVKTLGISCFPLKEEEKEKVAAFIKTVEEMMTKGRIKEEYGDSGTKEETPAVPGSWTCPCCGYTNNMGRFCSECGTPKPVEQETSE